MKVQRSQLDVKDEAEDINLNIVDLDKPTSQFREMKVRAISDKRGAPRGKSAKAFTKGDVLYGISNCCTCFFNFNEHRVTF